MRPTNGRWRPVTRREPCPACGHTDYCAWTPDGMGLRCMRGGQAPAGMTTATADAKGGTIYTFFDRNNGQHKPRRHHPAAHTPTAGNGQASLDSLAVRFRAAMTPERLTKLAANLGVTVASLDALAVGWATADDLRALKAGGADWSGDWPDGAYAFPERDGAGRLVGFAFRATDGRKGSPSSAAGTRRGLVIPGGLHESRDVVLTVEGASDVAACIVLGLMAIGRPSNTAGAENVGKLLGKRDVLVIGENDGKPTGAWPGRDGAERVAAQLARTRGKPVEWTLPPSGAKDVRAWLAARVAAGLDLVDSDACRAAGQELMAALRENATEAEHPKGASVAEQLVRLALEMYRFGQSDKGEPFAVAHSGPHMAVMLKGSAQELRAKLAREFRRTTGRTPGASALADALNLLEGEALDAEPEPVALRVAAYDGGIVIDLADAEGRAVIVRPGDWELLPRSPVLFRRTALTGPLPCPERGGALSDLRDLLNVTDGSWPLIAGWLVAALLSGIPHAILLLSGLQGTGKSCAARMLVNLFDPSPAPLRGEPRDLDRWQVQASGSWGVCLDNLSSIPPWLADALCRAATGDGLVKRKLYTDGDLAVLSFRRVILLTSIDPGALRGDLGERLLLGDLQPIVETQRRTEQEIDALFAARWPRLFGSLLDSVGKVLAALPDVRLERMPRMADFGRVLAAADAAGVTDGALDRYRGQYGRIAAEVIDADQFGAALVDFARRQGEWQGTVSELLAELLPDAAGKPAHGWPRANVVAGRLKRLTPALAVQGVRVYVPTERSKRGRIIKLESSGVGASPSSPASVSADDVRPHRGDDTGDDVTVGDYPGDDTALRIVTPKTSRIAEKTCPSDDSDDVPPLLSSAAPADVPYDAWAEL